HRLAAGEGHHLRTPVGLGDDRLQPVGAIQREGERRGRGAGEAERDDPGKQGVHPHLRRGAPGRMPDRRSPRLEDFGQSLNHIPSAAFTEWVPGLTSLVAPRATSTVSSKYSRKNTQSVIFRPPPRRTKKTVPCSTWIGTANRP